MKTFKCEYCEKKPTTMHGDEFLCSKHYVALYSKEDLAEQQNIVPKTKREKEMNAKYTKILRNFTFADERNFKKLVRDFKIDVKIIHLENATYTKQDSKG